jgi:hypothetical protein
MNRARIGVKMDGFVEKNGLFIKDHKVKVFSLWDVEHYRQGKLLSKTRDHNICTDQGLNSILDIMFHATTQITAWYVAIFESDSTPAAGNTYATPGVTESSAYTEGTRPAYVEAAASGKSMTNTASKAQFSINNTKTIYGGMLVGGGSAATTKADVAGGGTLFCSSRFTTEKSVTSGDVLYVTITIASSDV